MPAYTSSSLDGEALLPLTAGAPSATACAPRAPRPAATRCSALPGRLQGKHVQTIDVGRSSRRFIYYAPPTLSAQEPAPALIVPHGYRRSAQEMFELTAYDRIADREGFVVLYPEGQGWVPWNIGDGACEDTRGRLVSADGDDQAFIDAMLEFVQADRCLDREHVFMAGFGLGGYLATDTACVRSDVAAVASHSGGSHDLTACNGGAAPALFLHGQDDSTVPPTCSAEARDRFAARNGCSTEVETRSVRGGVCEYSLGCPEGGQVVLCLFDGLGATWAGSSGEASATSSASELTWSFFSTCAW